MGTAIGDVGIGAGLSPNDPFDWPNYSSGGTGLTAFESNGQGVLLGNYYTSPSSDANGTSGTFSSGPMYYSSGINKLSENYDLATINSAGEILAAVLDENENATSIVALNSSFSVPGTILSAVGWNSGDIFWNASHEITTGGYLWQPASGTQSASLNKLDALVAGSSGWSSIKTTGSSLGRKEINNTGAIVGTATLTTVTTNILDSPTTNTSIHGVLLLPVPNIITKVYSDQNGDKISGDLSASNYFSGSGTIGTGAGIVSGENNMGNVQSNKFLTMGFRKDGLGHLKVQLDLTALPASLANKIMVQLVSNDGLFTPIGNAATFANGDIVLKNSIYSASVTSENSCPGISKDPDPKDWLVAVGVDDGSGDLSVSNIINVSPFPIRAIDSDEYADSKAVLNTIEYLGRFRSHTQAANFLDAFLTDTSVAGSNSSIPNSNTLISPSESIPSVPQSIEWNVGAIYNPGNQGKASIRNNEFDSSSDLALHIEGSNAFIAYIKRLMNTPANDDIVNQKLASDTTDQTVQVDLPIPATYNNSPWDFTGLSFGDDDPDLKDSLHNVATHFTLTVVVNRAKIVQIVRVTGDIADIYEFYWPTSAVDYDELLTDILGKEAVSSAMAVQAGYNSLGKSGHIFESTINIEFQEPVGPSFFIFQ